MNKHEYKNALVYLDINQEELDIYSYKEMFKICWNNEISDTVNIKSHIPKILGKRMKFILMCGVNTYFKKKILIKNWLKDVYEYHKNDIQKTK